MKRILAIAAVLFSLTAVFGFRSAQAASATVLPELPAPYSVTAVAWQHHAQVRWSAVGGAHVYELDIAGTGATRFDRVLSVRSALVIMAPGTYAARVRAGRSYSDVHGHWSSPRYFRVPYPYVAPTARALAEALTRTGDPYVWGGAGPNDFDCSGLVMWAYEQLGISLPHNTVSMLYSGKLHRVSSPAVGDLAMWGGGSPYHVEFYLGSGYTFGAHHSGTDVGKAAIWGSPQYYYVG